ncbi:MAG: helix-turn-helix domain-containing protein [Melioribacteraceae bacterium]|jgi:transcriptional regulator with XRE-family HTH domain|nr:helix-turn-helix domain-containing protein [Melioribacteraceae bacterium]
MSIISNLIEIRKDKRINQKVMAKKLGISSGSLNRFEKGNRKIDMSIIEDYANKLGYELKLIVK